MGHVRARWVRAIICSAAAGIATASLVPAYAGDRPTTASDTAATKADARKAVRYCIRRATAGAASTERYCKTRDKWIAHNGYDPVAESRTGPDR